MSLWWLQPGWAETRCSCCGSTIYPEGDPDWGLCWPCMSAQTEENERMRAEEERHHLEMEEMERHYREHPHG